MQRLKRIVALLNVFVPVFFVWIAELKFVCGAHILTNGFMTYDALVSYHFWMYAMFVVNFLTSFILLRDEK